MTGCFIKLLSLLPHIVNKNGDSKVDKLEVILDDDILDILAILDILDSIKMPGHATQNLHFIQKKFLLSGVSSEYKDLAKFAEGTDLYMLKNWKTLCKS